LSVAAFSAATDAADVIFFTTKIAPPIATHPPNPAPTIVATVTDDSSSLAFYSATTQLV
jgi:hypothetical protein